MKLGNLFYKKKVFKPDVDIKLPKSDIGWSDSSALYTSDSFEKYNPDDLIGRKGFGIYKKMLQDEQVKAAIRFKRDAVTSRDYYFDVSKLELSDEEIEKRMELSEVIVDKIRGSFKDSLDGIMSATFNGFSMTEKVFEQIEYKGLTYWGVEKLKVKPFDTFYFEVDKFGNIEKVVQKLSGFKQEIDLEKFIHFVVNPDIDEHYGSSELRDIYRAWFSKDNIIKFYNMWLERHAGGFVTLQPKEGRSISADSTEFAKMKEILANINVASQVILPDWCNIEVRTPEKNVEFPKAIQNYDMAIARGMLVPNLLGVSPQGEHGSLAQSDTQLEAFLWTLESDSKRLEEVLNEQLFRQLASVNFGDSEFPKFKFEPLSDKHKIEIIKIWKDLVSSGSVRATDTDEEHIRRSLDFPEAGEEIKSPVVPVVDSNKLVEDENQENENEDDNSEISEEDIIIESSEKKKKKKEEETIIGAGRVSISAMTRAEKRVDFAVIGRTSEDSVDTHTQQVSKVMGQLLDEAITRIKTEELVKEDNVDLVKKFKFNTKLVTKLRKETQKFLRKGWDLGIKHARIEIDKAQEREFKADFKRLDFVESSFFDIKSFNITGNLTDSAIAIIKNIILNGAKGGKSTEQVINQIYKEFASAGLLSLEDVKEALGDALGVKNPDARINTVVRTSTFEAINEARYGYFTDPSLGGFVEALEYSAILDSRTTQICEELNGKIHAANSDVWSQYRPPNHYNCRSLLIPVTEVDDPWSEDEEPSIEPQRGFQ